MTHPTTKIQQVHTHKETYKFQQSFVTIFILHFYNANPLIYKGEVKALGLGHKTLVTFGKVTSGPTLKYFCLFLQKVTLSKKGDQIRFGLTFQLHNNYMPKVNHTRVHITKSHFP